ncbi:MAG: response regulator transcription factor [Anaerolineales bacterium]|nr:MAG: response regulator transcription factor [Anaerolineales bacterium]
MRILVVDDDRVLADVVAFTLRRDGFEVIQAYDGEAGLRRWSEDNPDLILLDINLPKLDGFKVCQQIRLQSDTPVIILTVRGEEDDIIHGLEVGADDYIPKPFSPRQLMARIHAVLRRVRKVPTPSVLKAGDLTLDLNRRAVAIGKGESVSLTYLENRLLEYLIVNSGHVLKTDAIIEYVWGPEGGDRDMLRQIVHRLRGKIEPDPSHPIYIETVPGVGYGLALPTSLQ